MKSVPTTGTMPNISRATVVAFLLLSALGVADALYLIAEHYHFVPLQCALLHGCDAVLGSTYSSVGKIPLAAFGFAYYAFMFVSALLALALRRRFLIVYAAYCTVAGFLFSLFLVYLQAFVIGAFCVYCLASAAISTMLFIFGATIIAKRKIKIYGS